MSKLTASQLRAIACLATNDTAAGTTTVILTAGHYSKTTHLCHN